LQYLIIYDNLSQYISAFPGLRLKGFGRCGDGFPAFKSVTGVTGGGAVALKRQRRRIMCPDMRARDMAVAEEMGRDRMGRQMTTSNEAGKKAGA
jgi:hypothetical protein